MKLKQFVIMLSILVLVSGCATEPAVVRKPPEPPEARLESISAALLMGDPEIAIAAHEQAFKNAPQDAVTHILHARLLILGRRFDEAKKEIDDVLAREPENTDALYAQALVAGLSGDKKNEKALLEKTISAKDPPAEAFSSLGSSYLEEKNYGKAREFFTKAQSKDGQNLIAAIGLGSVSFKEKKFEDAKKYFDRAVELQPDYPFSYSDRALVKRQLGDSDGALQDLDTAITLEPDYGYNYYDRGRLLMDKGKGEAAVAQFTLAVGKDPEMFAAYVMRGGLYDDMNRVDEAIADYETIIKLRPEYPFTYSLLGTLYLLKDEPEKAFGMFENAAATEKNTPEYILLAALALKKAGKNKEAAAYLKEKLSQLPRPGWQYNMAQFYIAPESDSLTVNDANHETNKIKKAQMLFYLAEQFLLLDKKFLARTYFAEAAGVERPGLIEKRLAQSELYRIAGK